MLKAVSLFSGCGGSDRGLVDAGCQIVMANDILPYAKDVYEANLPDTDFRLGKIEEIEAFPEADILAGCYPCQGYSQGGARKANRKVNRLYREFDRALRQIRPKAFIVENVPGMKRSNNKHLLDDQLRCFRSAGYTVLPPEMINSVDYVWRRNVEDCLSSAIRSDLGMSYEFPKPTHGPGLKPVRTQQDCLSMEETWPEGEFYDQGFHWYYLSRNRYRGWGSPSKTVLANARHMPLHPMSPPLRKVGVDEWVFDGDEAKRADFRTRKRRLSKIWVIGNSLIQQD